MSNPAANSITISNGAASVSVDLFGGAITDFHLPGNINLLTFKLSADSMPQNNRAGASYQGHFICLGRWGAPTDGEIKAGIPNHGQAANTTWTGQSSGNNEIKMQAVTLLEGLQINRSITLDDKSAVFKVDEQVKNINPLGRLYNIVQHPTVASPFLTANTVVNCNADIGFNYMLSAKPAEHAAQWPYGITESFDQVNLSKPDKPYSSVFSFIVKKDAEFGWITAYSPEYNLLMGYLWKREDYPWISLWNDFDGDNIRYRGLEFGTTGMHKPYKQIMDERNHRVFDEDSYKYVDAGETQGRGYLVFMCNTPPGFTGMGDVSFNADKITIDEAATKQQIIIQTTLKC